MPDTGSIQTEQFSESVVCDDEFAKQARYLRSLKRFVIKEAIKVDQDKLDVFNLGGLNNVRFNRKGRSPTEKEWKSLDEKLFVLHGCLQETQLKRFRISQSDDFLMAAPLLLLLTAVILLLPFLLEGIAPVNMFLIFVIFAAASGALGSAAFLIVNALGYRRSLANS